MEISIRTARLSIAPWPSYTPPEDLAALAAILTPTVLAPLPPHLQDARDIGAWIAARQAASAVWSLRTNRDATLLGMVQVARDEDAPQTTYRLGYLLGEAAWGQGYASEAVAGLLDALSQRGPACVLAGAVASNRASIRVLEKCGFTGGPQPDAPDMVLCRRDLPGRSAYAPR